MFNEDFNFASHLCNAAAGTGRVQVALAGGGSWAESSCADRAALMKQACLFSLWSLMLVCPTNEKKMPGHSHDADSVISENIIRSRCHFVKPPLSLGTV